MPVGSWRLPYLFKENRIDKSQDPWVITGWRVHTGPRIGDMRTFIEQLHDRRLAEIILSLIQRMNVINQGFQSYHSGVEGRAASLRNCIFKTSFNRTIVV